MVDDCETSLRIQEYMLSTSGYDVLKATGGAEALRLVGAYQPDLIVMDVMMPGTSGFEVLSCLREAIGHRQMIPVIMVTVRGEAEDAEQAYRLGCSDYLTKPLEARELISAVRRQLG